MKPPTDLTAETSDLVEVVVAITGGRLGVSVDQARERLAITAESFGIPTEQLAELILFSMASATS